MSASQWVAEARTTLAQLQLVCDQTSVLLGKTSALYEEFRRKHVVQAAFADDYLYLQLEVLGRIEELVHGVMAQEKHRRGQQTGELLGAMAALDRAVASLQATALDQAYRDMLVQKRPETTERTLYDFVSTDSIEELRLEMESGNQNYEMGVAPLRAVAAEVAQLHKLFAATLHLEVYQQGQVIMPASRSTEGGARPTVATVGEELEGVLRDNVGIEQELVSNLESVGKHYDQCLELKRLLGDSDAHSQDEARQLQRILAGDAPELPNVLRDMEVLQRSVIDNYEYCRRVVGEMAQVSPWLAVQLARHNLVTGPGNQLQLVMERLPQAVAQFQETVVALAGACSAWVATAGELVDLYRLFHRLYQHMLAEIVRRQQTAHEISEWLQEHVFARGLAQFQQREAEARGAFWAQHHASLPNSLLLPDFVRYALGMPEVEVVQHVEELPELLGEQEHADAAE